MIINRLRYDQLIEEAREISITKNKLYGNKNLLKYGEIGLFIRINDKIARIENIINNNKNEKESLKDNCLDLINYLLYIIMINEGELIENNKL